MMAQLFHAICHVAFQMSLDHLLMPDTVQLKSRASGTAYVLQRYKPPDLMPSTDSFHVSVRPEAGQVLNRPGRGIVHAQQ